MDSNLDEILLREICEQVPSIFSGDDHTQTPQDNLLSQLSNKLELLFSRDTPPDLLYKNLKEQGGGSTVCGRVFDQGDYFYTCIECRTDPTCVFCKDCFFVSTHINHNYKMFASGGAGCCDCGDVEAWSKDPHCDKHKPRAECTHSDPLASLPSWLMSHGHAFCHFIFEYALIFQNYKDWQSLPPHYQIKLEECFLRPDSHCLMVINDEVNTFDGVVTMFNNILGFKKRDSLTITYAIDKLGRGLVFRGSEEDCLQKQRLIPLIESKPLPLIIAQHQQCSVFLLNTLLSFCTQTPGLQKLCSLVLFSTDYVFTNGSTLLDYLFSNFASLWVSACEAWMGIFLQVVIPQEEVKIMLADCYIKNYLAILNQYTDNSSKEHCSLHFLSVQLFTSPSLALNIIQNSQALIVITRLLENTVSNKGTVKRPIASSDLKAFPKKLGRSRFLLAHDLGYLLRHSPAGVVLTQPLQHAFFDGFKEYIRVLRYFEEADAVKKVIGIHILIEPDWNGAFNTQRLLQSITTGYINWMSQDKALLMKGIEELFNELKSLSNPSKIKFNHKIGFDDYTYKSPEGKVSRIAVSCHLPLTRLLSGLLSSCHLHSVDIYVHSSLREDIVKRWLFERAIRPIVFKSQVSNQHWKRNGFSVINMVLNYHSFMCNEMYYRDLYMLQLVAANLSPQYILFNLIEKFEVSNWFNQSTESKKSDDDFVSNMCEEMMGTLIAILLERNNTNLADLTCEQVAEQNLINLLFLKEWTHSKLLDNIARGNFYNDHSFQYQLDTYLPKLAKESCKSGKNKFTLKPEYYDRVCLFSYHDSKENQSQAMNQLKTLAKPDSGVLQMLLTPPILPNFRPHLRSLLNIFEHPAFFSLIYIILDRTLKEDALLSDFTTHQALFLIALGLQEEENGRISNFSRTLKSKNFNFLHILTKLSSCASCADIRPLIDWINRAILSKEEFNSIFKEVKTGSLEQNEILQRGKMQQNRAMDRLKQQQAAFLEKFTFDDENDDQFEDAIDQAELDSLTQPITGVGVHCLNVATETQTIDCIFCQESSASQIGSEDGKLWVLPASCIPSSVLKKTQRTVRSLAEFDALLPHATLEFGVITKGCGHCFHFSCWEQFMKSSSTSHSQLVISPSEFKCPLCNSVCNTIIPLSLGMQYNARVSETDSPPSFEQFLTLISLINNAKYYTRDAIKIATTFSESFCINQQRSNSTSLYIQNSKTFKILEKCRQVAYPDISPETEDPSFPLLSILSTLNYTLQSKYNELAGLEQNLLKDVSSHQQLVLRSLIHLPIIYSALNTHQIKCGCANTILQSLLPTSCDIESKMFDYDAFSLLVNLQLSLPHLISQVLNDIPNSSVSLALLPTISQHVFKLLLYYRIVQIVMFLNLESISLLQEPDGVNRDPLFKLWSLRRKALPKIAREAAFSMKALHEEMLRFLLPFLRSCALFYNLLFGIPLPKQLNESVGASATVPSTLEVDILLAYLDCPLFMECLTEMLANRPSDELIRTWFAVNSSSSLAYARDIQHPSLIISPYGGLIDLPQPYMAILTEASNYNCPVTSRKADNVIKCLVCGKCLCICCFACIENYKLIYQDAQALGPFATHMMQCSNGIGIGIWVKSAHLVLLSCRSRVNNQTPQITGTLQSIPYLDKFGEHDDDLRKGSPLFLSQEYIKIKQMWLRNEIPRIIEKSREEHHWLLDFQTL